MLFYFLNYIVFILATIMYINSNLIVRFFYLNIIDTTIIDIITDIKSASSPTIREYLIFFIPILAKYNPII